MEPNYLEVKRGLGSWLVTLDHKRIGVMYLAGILTALLVGGLFALLVRIELAHPGGLFTPDQYNQFFTLHGAVMVFLVIIPGIPAALGFSSIFTGLNFLVTIHKFRAKGMGWFNLPLNLWAVYATAIIQVLATPVLGITVLLLFVEKVMQIGIFDPSIGGDPVLFQHFFWFYSHPAVYIMILPAMGVISELMTTFSRKHIFGYRFIAYSSIALALLSFLVWGHHMFVSGQSPMATMIFSALTFTVAIPSAIKVFNWVTTLYKGEIYLKTPMLYALSFMLLFTIGGLTGLFLGILSVDVHLHDTYFVVAHFHYVMMGSTLVAFLGALHYWFPKMSGKMYPERLGQICAIGVFIGFNLTFLPQFIMGARGMPRRYWDYDPEFTTMHQLSTLGAFILGISMFVTVVYLVHAAIKGKVKAPANPWGASTLEWQTSSPPPLYNFHEAPERPLLYHYEDFEWDDAENGYLYRPAKHRKVPTAKHLESEPNAEPNAKNDAE
jgi:cytochrome c oxidase subunit 1